MKIGMMTDNYQTHVSGVTNHISLNKKWLEKADHQVYVFTFGKTNGFDEKNNIILTRGLPITDFYTNIYYNSRAKEILSTMDIVHVHHPFMSGLLASRYCAPRNIPIVFTNHTRYDLYSKAYLPMLPSSISEAALKAYLSRFYRSCDLVIVPSARMQDIMTNNFGLDAPVVVIPNGVDLEPFSDPLEPVDRQKLGFSGDDIIAIFVGRLGPEKNLKFLVEAFSQAISINPLVRLLLVGDGPERENLEAQAKRLGLESKIFFTGLIPYHEVPGYLDTADIFITASLTEVFPLATIEAIGAGLPVLGIDAPGTSDIIEDGVTGLISTDDLDTFTAKLLHLSTNEELRKQMGQKARQEAQKYDIQNITQILIRHYQRLIEAAGSREKSRRYHLKNSTDNL